MRLSLQQALDIQIGSRYAATHFRLDLTKNLYGRIDGKRYNTM